MNIKKANDFIRKNSLIIKIVLSYIIVGVVLISVLSFSLYRSYSSSSIGEIGTISQKMLSQSYTVSDTILTQIYNYFWQFYNQNPQAYNALYSKTFDPIETGDINKKLCNEVSANPWLYSLYIINGEADLVFSNLTTMKPIDEFYDRDIIRIVNEKNSDQRYVIIPRKVEYTINDKVTRINLLTIIFAENYNDSKIDAALVINVNQEELQKVLSRNGDNEASTIFIVNKDGIVISHPDALEFNRNIKDKQYVSKILETRDNSGSFSMDVNGENCMITYIKSTKMTEWSFISIGEYKKLLKRVKSLQGSILLITAVFVLLGILIAFAFGSRIYIPLYNLIKKIKTNGISGNTQIDLSEYDYLNNTFDILVKDVKNLSADLNRAKIVQKKEILRQLVQGEIIWGKGTAKQLEVLNIHSMAKYYIVCVLCIDSFEELNRKNSLNDIALFRFAIGNIFQEVLDLN